LPISNVEVVRIAILVSNLRLPLLGRKEGVVLNAQTGRREAKGLSALARGRLRREEESREAQKTEESAENAQVHALH
jgi:hypothetical protein